MRCKLRARAKRERSLLPCRGTRCCMLHRVKALKGDPIVGDDGDVGSIDDLYFDARRWGVCFLVVATGPWGIGRKLMISPSSVERSSPDARMRVRMTRKQVESNPEVDENPGGGGPG